MVAMTTLEESDSGFSDIHIVTAQLREFSRTLG
jgi:hypothetical protein